MLAYRVRLARDDNDTVLVDFPDFPEAHTFGNDNEDALIHARDALETIIDAYMKNRRPVPLPSAGAGRRIELPARAAAKLELYMEMLRSGVRKAELARRLGWKQPQVDRLLSLRHPSQLERLEAAASALKARLVLSVVREPVTIRRGPGRRQGVPLPVQEPIGFAAYAMSWTAPRRESRRIGTNVTVNKKAARKR